MSGHIDDVINPSHHPEVAVGIAASAIASEIQIGAIRWTNVLPITLPETLGVAMHRAHHSRPRSTHREIAPLVIATTVALSINDVGLNSRQGQGR